MKSWNLAFTAQGLRIGYSSFTGSSSWGALEKPKPG